MDWDDKMFEIYEIDRPSFTTQVDQFQNCIHEEDRTYVNTIMQYAAYDHRVHHAAFRIITPSGKLKFIDGNIQAVCDFEGKAIGFAGVNKDVTNRKMAEAGRLASEESYRKLLKEFSKLSVVAEKTINAVVITDANGETEWVNSAFTKMTGYFLHELKNKKPGNVLQGPETDPLSIALMSSCIKHKKSFELSVVNYRKNKEKYWVNIIANPYFDETGKLEGFISIQTETTEQKNLEEKIRAERDKAKMYLDIVGSIVVILDTDGIVLLANKAAVKMTAADSYENIVGSNWFEKYVPPEIQEELTEKYANAMSGREDIPDLFEHEIVDTDGNRKLIEWHNVLLKDESNNITGCISSGKDITEQRKIEIELKESKDFYRSVFNGSLNAVLLADDNNRYLDANPAAQRLLGYTRSELLGMSAADIVTGEKSKSVNKLWEEFMDEQHQTGLIELKGKDGRKVIAEYRATANIKPGVHLSILTNVTEKIEYENAIARQNQILREIAFIQSHEIRRPVANILGLYELLKLEAQKTESKVLESMLVSVQELDEMIRNLVLKSRSLEEEAYERK